jgi:hypothetical protein
VVRIAFSRHKRMPGPVKWSSSDTRAVFSPPSAPIGSSAQATFTVTFRTKGKQSLTVKDATSGKALGRLTGIQVN